MPEFHPIRPRCEEEPKNYLTLIIAFSDLSRQVPSPLSPYSRREPYAELRLKRPPCRQAYYDASFVTLRDREKPVLSPNLLFQVLSVLGTAVFSWAKGQVFYKMQDVRKTTWGRTKIQ